jgi:hypothetical protein
MGRHFDNISMNTGKPAFVGEVPTNAPEFKPTVTAEDKANKETFEQEGVKIYEKTTDTGDIKYFDTNGKEVPTRIIDTMFEKYPALPEFNQQGGEKKDKLQVTNTTYTPNGKENFEDGKIPEYVVERQEYTEGDTIVATIPKEYYMIVRFLRGEFSGKGKEKESSVGNEGKK